MRATSSEKFNKLDFAKTMFQLKRQSENKPKKI
jgi:hypothetical protein